MQITKCKIYFFGLSLYCSVSPSAYRYTTVTNIVILKCNLGSMYLLVLLFKYISHPFCQTCQRALTGRGRLSKSHKDMWSSTPFIYLPPFLGPPLLLFKENGSRGYLFYLGFKSMTFLTHEHLSNIVVISSFGF